MIGIMGVGFDALLFVVVWVGRLLLPLPPPFPLVLLLPLLFVDTTGSGTTDTGASSFMVIPVFRVLFRFIASLITLKL